MSLPVNMRYEITQDPWSPNYGETPAKVLISTYSFLYGWRQGKVVAIFEGENNRKRAQEWIKEQLDKQ